MNSVISDNLEKIRLKNNLTNTKIAEIMGITRQTYHKSINGTRDFKWSEMANLRLELEVDLNKLVLSNYQFCTTEKDIVDNELSQLYKDFVEYDINPIEVRKLIIKKIFISYFSKKSFYEKLVQNNRAIVDFANILYNLKFEQREKALKNKSKMLLIDKIKKSQSKVFEKRVKKNILEKISILNEKDCYYILTFNKLAAEILVSFISENDIKFLKRIGYKELLVKLNY